MLSRAWHLYINGETLGPLSTEVVVLMLKQGRLQFLDFVWAKHLTKWQRLADLDDFQSLIPPYPKASIPSNASDGAEPDGGTHTGGRGRAEIENTAAPAAPKVKHSLLAASNLTPEPRPEPPRAAASTPAPTPASVSATSSSQNWPKVRRFVRVSSNTEKARLAEYGDFEVINISEGGIFLRSSEPLPIGAEVRVTLELASLQKSLDMTGVVIRHGVVDDVSGMAVEFTRLNPAHKRLLQAYVSDLASSR